MRWRGFGLALALVLVLGVVVVRPYVARSASPAATGPGPFEYSAKFACGQWDKTFAIENRNQEGPVKPGDYATVINVHNPNVTANVTFFKKAVMLFNGATGQVSTLEQPAGPTNKVQASLRPDFGLEIDCTDIRKLLVIGAPPAPAFIEGWVVIVVPPSSPTAPTPLLNVTALYTAHTFAPGPAGTPPVAEGFGLDLQEIHPIQGF